MNGECNSQAWSLDSQEKNVSEIWDIPVPKTLKTIPKLPWQRQPIHAPKWILMFFYLMLIHVILLLMFNEIIP